jgi:hypothetical protein
MNLTALHRRLLQDVLEIGNAFPIRRLYAETYVDDGDDGFP